jgi:farnesol dehydrogenase
VKVLVTGGTGYLGSAIVRAAVEAGHEPVVFARRAGPDRAVRTIEGDVRDTRAVTRAAEGVDAICHTAALVSLWRRDPSEFDAINVAGLQSALAAARALSIPRLVYTSSFLALPPRGIPHPLTANAYQRTKVAARDVARRAAADGLPIVILYPGVVYGPGPATEGNLVGRLMADHVRGSLPGTIGADRIWSFAFVDDVARAHVSALVQPNPAREYTVGGTNAPQRTMFEYLARTRGTRLPRQIPYALASCAAVLEEARARLTGRPPRLTRGAVEIFRHDWPLDGTAAMAALGVTPTALEEGLARTVSFLQHARVL